MEVLKECIGVILFFAATFSIGVIWEAIKK